MQSTFSKLVDFVKGDQDIPQVDTHWMSESGVIDVFFLLGPGPNHVFKQYALLTGTTPLPPVSTESRSHSHNCQQKNFDKLFFKNLMVDRQPSCKSVVNHSSSSMTG